MGQRDLGFLIVPIVALLAVLIPAAGAPSRTSEAAAKTSTYAAAAVAKLPPRTASALLEEYGSIAASTQAVGNTNLKSSECLIATLPDPVDAGNLNYTFDRYLDALQRAFEADGYVLDRYDLPWLEKPPAEPSPPPRFRTEPGRLLFRRTSAPAGSAASTALVFIVGETPTAGIHKAAFARAVSELAQSCESASPIKLLGPSFSGSSESLKILLKNFSTTAFTIVSGSATAIDASALTSSAATGTTFRTTIVPDAEARREFLRVIVAREEARAYEQVRHFFRSIGVLRSEHRLKVALLTESNTGFGQASTTEVTSGTVDPSGLRLDLIRLPFPLHIASLRVASNDTPSASHDTSERATGMARLTRLDLRDPTPSTLVMPLMSQLENPSMEIVLNTLLKTLEEERVRYIGLVATDVRDRIFLAQQIHHHLPNTAVFMFSGDLLYMHPDVNVDLRGVQVITSYPLFTANQLWTPSGSSAHFRLLFPTHTTQGVYNATLQLLGLATSMQEYGYPFDPRKPPAIWLSVVGAEGLQPTHLLAAAGSDAIVPVAEAASGSFVPVPLPDQPWLPAIAVVLCVIPAVYVFFNLDATRKWTEEKTPALRSNFVVGRLAQLFSDTVYRSHTLPRHLYRFACWSALTCAYIVTMTTFLLPPLSALTLAKAGHVQLESGVLSPMVLLVLLGGMVVMLSTLALLGMGVWKEGDPIDTRHRRIRQCARVSIGIGSLFLLALSLRLSEHWTSLALSSPADGVLLYMRSSDFATGVSPLLPLVLVCSAAVAWSVSALRRLRLLEGPDQYAYAAAASATVPNSFLGFQGSSFEGISLLERDVLNAIGRRSTALPWPVLLTIFAALLIAWMRLFGPRSIPTGEGPAFDALFALGFLIVYTGLALSFVRFVVIWRKLLRLLQRLAWHPTVKAYARLGQTIPGKPRINLTSPSQIFTALEFSVDRAGQLAALGRELAKSGKAERRFTVRLMSVLPDLQDHVEAAECGLHSALAAEADGDWRALVRQRTDAEQALSTMATRVTELVRPAWRLPATDAPEKGKEEPTEIQWFELAEDFLTSRVAAFLSHVVPQLQNLIVFVTAGLLLMLLAVTSYPFQPHQLLLLFNTAVILAAVATTLVVFVQMERETILSVLSDTTPGKINWNRDFVSRIAVYVGLPIISLLGAQFPEIAQQLFTWTSSLFGTH
jgi:hypothetical protein